MELQYEIQLSALRDRVWIHCCADGSTVGRFGAMGIDLHNTLTEQLAGAPECRLCTHGAPTVNDWHMFRAKALEWWGVDIPEDAVSQDWLQRAR